MINVFKYYLKCKWDQEQFNQYAECLFNVEV